MLQPIEVDEPVSLPPPPPPSPPPPLPLQRQRQRHDNTKNKNNTLCKFLFTKGVCGKNTCEFRHEVGPAFWRSRYASDRFRNYNNV